MTEYFDEVHGPHGAWDYAHTVEECGGKEALLEPERPEETP